MTSKMKANGSRLKSGTYSSGDDWMNFKAFVKARPPPGPSPPKPAKTNWKINFRRCPGPSMRRICASSRKLVPNSLRPILSSKICASCALRLPPEKEPKPSKILLLTDVHSFSCRISDSERSTPKACRKNVKAKTSWIVSGTIFGNGKARCHFTSLIKSLAAMPGTGRKAGTEGGCSSSAGIEATTRSRCARCAGSSVDCWSKRGRTPGAKYPLGVREAFAVTNISGLRWSFGS
mmetsp:Transcript_2446/g.9538  ORF Transcript_2446/g.9538 Transcript_2446/m.9538 type:complete len:234 (+) Transcript_2446:523-1224(+)